jgi:hypothetical protein
MLEFDKVLSLSSQDCLETESHCVSTLPPDYCLVNKPNCKYAKPFNNSKIFCFIQNVKKL